MFHSACVGHIVMYAWALAVYESSIVHSLMSLMSLHDARPTSASAGRVGLGSLGQGYRQRLPPLEVDVMGIKPQDASLGDLHLPYMLCFVHPVAICAQLA